MYEKDKGILEKLENDCPDITEIDPAMTQDSQYINALIESFNKEVGNNGWCSARATYLARLHNVFLASGLDCSEFVDKGGMSMGRKIHRQGNRLVTIDAAEELKKWKERGRRA